LEFKGVRKEYFGGDAHTTNNRMELQGVIEGLKLLKEPCDVEIISDSSYVIKAINEWLEGWVRKNFSKVKNVDLWKEYLEISSQHTIRGTWVRGHNGHPENERCDELARNEAERIKLTL
jgi:ribonuclease HI